MPDLFQHRVTKTLAPLFVCAALIITLGYALTTSLAQGAPAVPAPQALAPAAGPTYEGVRAAQTDLAQADFAQAFQTSDPQTLQQNLASSQKSYNTYQNNLRQQASQAAASGYLQLRQLESQKQALQPALTVQPQTLTAADPALVSPQSVQSIPAPSFILQPLHRNGWPGGLSSGYSITNTSPSAANVVLDYHWANGDLVYSQNLVIPALGRAVIYLPNIPELGDLFYGYVQVTSDQLLTGQIGSQPFGALGGRVFQPDGVTPVGNLGVTAFLQPNNRGKYDTRTFADGSFYIGGLPSGPYILRINAEAPYAGEFYNQAISQPAAHIFDLGQPLQITSTQVVLLPGGQISGTVYAADGVTPLSNINVDLQQGWYGACTDNQGHYTINGAPYGANKVHAGGGWNWCANAPSPYIEQFYNNAPYAELGTTIFLSSTQTAVGGIDFQLLPGGTIHGRVTSALSGQGLSGVNVTAWAPSAKNWAGTDPNGYYTMTGLTAADYQISVDPNTLPPGLGQIYYPAALSQSGASLVSVTQGGDVSGINLVLPAGGAIHGRVLNAANGSPVANTSVNAALVGPNQGPGVCTDPDGYYTLKGLPYADYTVNVGGDWDWCRNQSSPYIRQWYDHVSDFVLASHLTVSAASPDIQNINFDLTTGSTLQGRVTDAATGLPVANVYVMTLDPYTDKGQTGASTDQNGYYTISGLAPGSYHLRAEAHSLPAGYGQIYYPNTINWQSAGMVTISANQTITGLNLALPPGGSISGRVTDKQTGQPVANLNLNAGNINLPFGIGTCTDANGYYTLPGLPYSSYNVNTDSNWNWCKNEPAVYPTTLYSATYQWKDAVQFDVGPAQPNYNSIDLRLEKGAFIQGTVKDEAGNPVVGMQLNAGGLNNQCQNCWDGFGRTQTDQNGVYSLGPLPPFNLFVEACPACTGLLYYNQYYSASLQIQNAQIFNLSPGQTVGGINFTMHSGVILSGTVSVPAGLNAASAPQVGGYSPAGIQIDVWPNGSFNYYVGTQTDSQGHYQVSVPPVMDVLWSVAARPYGTNLGAQWASNFDLSKQHLWDFNLTPGSTIQGCIRDGGQPVSNVWVNAWSPAMGNGTQVGPDGCYQINNLPAGSYSLRAEGWPDRLPTYYGPPSGQPWLPLELRAGEIFTANLSMPLAGQISGHVTAKPSGAALEGVRLAAINAQGVWETNSQPDGSYILDAPAGQYKLLAIPPDWQVYNNLYYPNSLNYGQALTITLPARSVGVFNADLALDGRGSLSGLVLDAATSQPLQGIHIILRGLNYPDQQTNAWWNVCTDPSGQYRFDGIDPGQFEIQALGTCSRFAYAPYTQTLNMPQAGSLTHNLLLQKTGLRQPGPFQVLVEESFDHSPTGLSINGVGLANSEDVINALFTPLAHLDDTGLWRTELLTALPTFENGLAAIRQESLVVTYTLKPGLSWADGAPLTSADIAFTWRKLTQPSPYTSYDLGKPLFHIQSVSTPNPLTAVLTFRPRYYTSNYLLAVTYLLPEHLLSTYHLVDIMFGSKYANLPVGNGPYLAAGYMPGAYLDVRANPNYVGASRGLPNIKAVRFTFIGDPYQDLTNRMVDAAANVQYSQALPPNYAAAPLQIVQSETGGVEFMYLNTTRPQLSEPEVRQALWLALDRQGAIAQQPTGTSAPGASYLPVSSPFYNPANQPAPFNLTQAANLLTAAGWTDHNASGTRDKNGVELRFSLAYNPGNQFRSNLSLKFQSDLASIGVELTLQPFPSLGAILEQFKLGEMDAVSVAWMGFPPYDSEFVRELTTANIPTAYNSYNGSNYARFSSPANDLLIQSIFQPQDFAALKQAYLAHQAEFAAQLPQLPTQHFTRLDGARPDLVNFKPSGTTPLTWNIAEWILPENPYDLAVFAGLAPGSPQPTAGGLITYEINTVNSGFLTVTQASLVDALPANAAFVRAVPAPDSTPPAGSLPASKYWSLGSFGPGQRKTVLLVVKLSDTLSQGELVQTSVQVSGFEPDSRPGNNGFTFSLAARTKADLAVSISGSGQPSVGEKLDYFIDYTNLGGTTVPGAVVTATLPAQMTYLLAEPAPTSRDGQTLTWALPPLQPMQWGGRILVRTRIDSAGAATAQARIGSFTAESSTANNSSSHTLQVTGILAPVITRPTIGVTDGTPTFAGLAPAGALVKLYNISGGSPVLLGSVSATLTGTFQLELSLTPGTYIVIARAEKSSLTSANSNAATITVQTNLALDPDYVTITDAGVDVSTGAVRTQRRLRAFSQVTFDLRLPCASQPTAYLDVTENGLFQTNLPPTLLEPLPNNQWHVRFDLWLANVRSSYNVFVVWNCGLGEQRELLVYILIDPDGYVFDQSLVSAGASMTDSLITSAVITAFVKTGSDWVIWPAALYGQTNPQNTDNQSGDGVATPGYYSFLTPSGQYRIQASAPGFQPYESPVLTVITTPVHLDIGMQPVQVSVSSLFKPADLSASNLQTNQPSARMGSVLTYTLHLANSGQVAASLVLTDVLPAGLLLEGGLSASTGQASYNPATRAITWKPTIGPEASASLTFRVRLLPVSSSVVNLLNTFSVSGPPEILLTLPALESSVTLDPGVQILLPILKR